jgi:acetyl esterase/lipase
LGLERDALATLEWIQSRYSGRKVNIILYGHSLGAGVACFAAANCAETRNLCIRGIILETPFTSVSEMLVTLYPQKWLPYRYLSPFLWSSWDIKEYLSNLSTRLEKPRVMIVQAEQDEIVEKWMAPEIQKFAIQKGFTVDFFIANGALHFQCMTSREFSVWVSGFIAHCMKD